MVQTGTWFILQHVGTLFDMFWVTQECLAGRNIRIFEVQLSISSSLQKPKFAKNYVNEANFMLKT